MPRGPMPDLLGRPLDRAARALADTGWEVTTVQTAPPGRRPAGPGRVVRQRQVSDALVELTAAAQIELPRP